MRVFLDELTHLRGEVETLTNTNDVFSSYIGIMTNDDSIIYIYYKNHRELYAFCRKHNFEVIDERTNVERYIQDGRLLWQVTSSKTANRK
jgi:hypothetical protein